MPRKKLIRSNRLPYHVDARCNNREDFPITKHEMWGLFQLNCAQIRLLFDVEIHALVMMSNHFHMLLTTPNQDLGEVMQYFIRSLTRSTHLKSGRSGRLFGGRYHETLIDSELYYYTAFKYVYRNPVRAGICEKVEDHPYSTLQGLLGEEQLLFPLHHAFERKGISGLFESHSSLLRWLNRPTPKEAEERIKKALLKTRFKMPSNGWKRAEPLPEKELFDALSIKK